MIPQPLLLVACILCLVAAGLWGRSALIRMRLLRKVEGHADEVALRQLVSGDLARDTHAMGMYVVIALFFGVAYVTHPDLAPPYWMLGGLVVPLMATMMLAQYARRDGSLARNRLHVERRAMEVLQQEESAPQRWAERLAPSVLPDTPGYELGTAHQAGVGVMSGDLLDVFELPGGRLGCVVGDVSGHDVEASITALQTKFLLRSYLRRFRDPGQALEELNRQLVSLERPEEFVSLCVVVLDQQAETLRYASAGHPAAWFVRDREIHPLRSTGPLLMMEGGSEYLSREELISPNDVVVMLTDGLAEARAGEKFFGEERLAAMIRKNSDLAPSVLCKLLVDAAAEFSDGPIADDVTVLAVRKA